MAINNFCNVDMQVHVEKQLLDCKRVQDVSGICRCVFVSSVSNMIVLFKVPLWSIFPWISLIFWAQNYPRVTMHYGKCMKPRGLPLKG